MKKYWHLNFWDTGEWQVIKEHLDDLRHSGTIVCPPASKRFLALEKSSPDTIKVAIFGQDPYPDVDACTGYAFSTPPNHRVPRTLDVIFDEYESDLHYTRPTSGDLSAWVEQGILLWNAIPTCTAGHSLSHDWPEWELLNEELIGTLVENGCGVFCFLGGAARRYAKFVPPWLHTIETAHPSPRANISSKTPFKGSRIFSKINDCLADLQKETIDWRLP